MWIRYSSSRPNYEDTLKNVVVPLMNKQGANTSSVVPYMSTKEMDEGREGVGLFMTFLLSFFWMMIHS